MIFKRPTEPKNAVSFFIKNYLNPHGLTVKKFVRTYCSKKNSDTTILMMNGKITMTLLQAMSKYSGLSISYWFTMQYNFRFFEFERTAINRVKISLKKKTTVGLNPRTHLIHHLKLSGIRIYDLKRIIGQRSPGIRKNLLEICIDSIKLSAVVGQSSRYWIDRYVYYTLLKKLKANLPAKHFVRAIDYIEKIFVSNEASQEYKPLKKSEQPKVFIKRLLQKSEPEFTLRDWSLLLLIKKNTIIRNINGNELINYDFIVALSKVLNLDPIALMSRFIRYFYSIALQKSNKEIPRLRSSLDRAAKQSSSIRAHLKFYVYQRGFSSIVDFCRWSGISIGSLNAFTKKTTVGPRFELCFKIGDALGVDPYHWAYLNLQNSLKIINDKKVKSQFPSF